MERREWLFGYFLWKESETIEFYRSLCLFHQVILTKWREVPTWCNNYDLLS